MKKIPTMFIRGEDHLVTRQVHPECQWVLNGEGVATRKWDGTCCLVRDGKLYKRYELKPGAKPPEGFEPAQEPDPNTGKQPGWLPVGDGPEDRWHREAFEACKPEDGTYELIGPKVQGNKDHSQTHVLVRHGEHILAMSQAPRSYDTMREFLEWTGIEGIVWHHNDGRMAKIKRRDFGFKW